MPNRQISENRKATYYAGMVLMAIGFILFLSVFVTGFTSMGKEGMPDVAGAAAEMQSFGFRALGGILLAIVGGVLMSVGARGAAGSGIVLDPEKAREDLEPWARMAGGMVNDAADEAGVNLGEIAGHEDSADMPFDEKLRRLAKLHVEGVLTDEEYAREKQKILDEQ